MKSGKVFCGNLWNLGEYVESLLDTQSPLWEIRKVLGEIPTLASVQWLLNEANGMEDADGNGKKVDKLKEGGGRHWFLLMGHMRLRRRIPA